MLVCAWFQIVVNLKLLTEVTAGNGAALSLCRVSTKQQCVMMPLCVDCVINASGSDTLGSWVENVFIHFNINVIYWFLHWSSTEGGKVEMHSFWSWCFCVSCSVCSSLVGALHTQLSDMEETVLKYRKDKTLPVPQPFHFQLPAYDRLVTVIYPAGETDDQLLTVREARRPHAHTHVHTLINKN